MDKFVVGLCLASLAAFIMYWEWRADRRWQPRQRSRGRRIS